MAKDWRVVLDDTGGPFTGWPRVCSEAEDRCVLHTAGFVQEYWSGPSLYEAKQIAQLVADFMNHEP
jgi:hypothetical protein